MLHVHHHNASGEVDCVHCQVMALTPINYEVVQKPNHKAKKTKLSTSPNPLQFCLLPFIRFTCKSCSAFNVIIAQKRIGIISSEQ